MSLASRLVAMLFGCGAFAAAQSLEYPEEPGPFPVGVTSIQLDDVSRPDPELGPRPLRTEIWYPAPDAARGLARNLYSDFLLRGVIPGSITAAEEALGGYRKGITIAELDRTFENVALRDAPVREGKWPVIIFSHGFGGLRFNHVFLTEFLASHGYIVLAADHLGDSKFTLVNSRVVLPGGPRAKTTAIDRIQDVSFLIDAFTRMTQGGDGRFAGRADLNRLGAAGMSMGGGTILNAIEREPRIKAAVLLAPAFLTSARTNFTTPVCLMIGSEDMSLREEGNARHRAHYEASRGPRCLIEIKDAGHQSFSSAEQYNPNLGNGIGKGKRITVPDQEMTYLSQDESHRIVNAYAMAFFSVYLRGQLGYRGYLQKNHFGDKIVHKFSE
jgi:predicted dienelactone hydrolase